MAYDVPRVLVFDGPIKKKHQRRRVQQFVLHWSLPATMEFRLHRARVMLLIACLILLLHAALCTTLIHIVSPVAPSVGPFTCWGRVLHVRAAVSSSRALPDYPHSAAFLVDGQQLALLPVRSHAEVRIRPLPFVSVTSVQ
jgi:hypothetical protein